MELLTKDAEIKARVLKDQMTVSEREEIKTL